jgi:hypothetical protein
MPTVSLARALLSAAAVGMLLALLRHAGPRVGGLAAAVPINSMPALFWLSVEHGDAYAATAALGSLLGTGLTIVLGLVFARVALACHAAVAALLAWLVVLGLGAMTWALPVVPGMAAVLALVTMLVAPGAVPRRPVGARRRGDVRATALLTMAIAGAMSLLVSELSQHGGAQSCGLIAAIPVIGMCALQAGHRQGGAPLMFAVLGGYLEGMLAKAAFLVTLGAGWAAGAGHWAWAMAIAAAGCALLGQGSLRRWQERGGVATAPAQRRA